MEKVFKHWLVNVTISIECVIKNENSSLEKCPWKWIFSLVKFPGEIQDLRGQIVKKKNILRSSYSAGFCCCFYYHKTVFSPWILRGKATAITYFIIVNLKSTNNKHGLASSFKYFQSEKNSENHSLFLPTHLLCLSLPTGTARSGSTLSALSYDHKATTLMHIPIYIENSRYFNVLSQDKWKTNRIRNKNQSK